MSLDVTPPDPPRIFDETREEYEYDEARRADVQAFFENENAWGEGFEEWAEETRLSAAEYAAVRELGLIRTFDFHWDADAERVAYDAPAIPDDWADRDYPPVLDSWATVSKVNEELDDLGRTVADLLTDYYVDWRAREELDSEYRQLFGEQFNARDDDVSEDELER